jgi:hypothetical protein
MGASRRPGVGHYILGFLLIVFSAVVSGSVLQETDGGPSGTLTLTAGALAIAVVVLTSVQTTFKLGERGEQHRSAAVGFGQLERKLDVFIHRPHPNLAEAWDELLKIADEITNVETGVPATSSAPIGTREEMRWRNWNPRELRAYFGRRCPTLLVREGL